MDGRTRYNKISKLLKPLIGQTLHMNKLRLKLYIDIGSSEELIRECLRMMIDLGLIQEKKHMIFKVIRAEAGI